MLRQRNGGLTATQLSLLNSMIEESSHQTDEYGELLELVVERINECDYAGVELKKMAHDRPSWFKQHILDIVRYA